jgi:MFS family permease
VSPRVGLVNRMSEARGWMVVGGSFGVMFAGFAATYSFSAFLAPLEREFSASRGDVSLVFSIAICLYFLLGAATGPLAARIGARPTILLGIAILALGLFLAGSASTIGGVFLGYGLGIGLGIACTYVPSVAAVQPWFTAQRGLASGLAVAGIGVGTLAGPPFAELLINAFGWRSAFAALAVTVLVVGGLAGALVTTPDTRGAAPAEPVGPALRSGSFRWLYAGGVLIGVGTFIPFVHLVPYAEALGVPRATAVLLVGAIGAGSTAGRFLLGGLADRFGRDRSLAAMYAACGISLLLWLAASETWELFAIALAFGVSYGGFVALMPALTADLFGPRRASAVIGVLYTSVGWGALLGPSLAGYAYDFSGSYVLPIATGGILDLLAAVTVLKARRA